MFAHALHRACWVLWIGGTALIVLSWVEIVSPQVGWIGFAAAALGYVVSRLGQFFAPIERDEDASVWTSESASASVTDDRFSES